MIQKKNSFTFPICTTLAIAALSGSRSVEAQIPRDPAPNPTAPAGAPSITFKPYQDPWPAGKERWSDINNNAYGTAWYALNSDSNKYESTGLFKYGNTVTIRYDPNPTKPYFVAHIEATGLKPNFCYQLKLVGKPVSGDRGMTKNYSYVDVGGAKQAISGTPVNGDDWANEKIGYAGRWWDDDNNLSGTNLNDAYYQNYYKKPASGAIDPVTGKPYVAPDGAAVHPVYGYLFMGSFVTKADGSVNIDVTGQTSYHVDWPSWYLGGSKEYEHFLSPFSVAANTAKYGYGDSPQPGTVNLYYETQRYFLGSDRNALNDQRSVKVALPAGTYHCRFLLTEESFHADPSSDEWGGYWKTVLATEDFTYNADKTITPDTDPSNDIVFTMPPGGLTAASGKNQVVLSWPLSTGVTSYTVKRSTTPATTPGSSYVDLATFPSGTQSTVSFTDTLAPRDTYSYYVVSAVTSSEGIPTANSNEVKGMALSGVPLPPSGLKATAVSISQIDLSWTDTNNEEGFKVEQSSNNKTWTQIATLAANVTGYSNTGLTAGKTYSYRVRAYNNLGNSGYATASATTPRR